MILKSESRIWSLELSIIKRLDSAAQVPHARPEQHSQAIVTNSFDVRSSFDLVAFIVHGGNAPHDVGEIPCTRCLQILSDESMAFLPRVVAHVFLRFHCVKNPPLPPQL